MGEFVARAAGEAREGSRQSRGVGGGGRGIVGKGEVRCAEKAPDKTCSRRSGNPGSIPRRSASIPPVTSARGPDYPADPILAVALDPGPARRLGFCRVRGKGESQRCMAWPGLPRQDPPRACLDPWTTFGSSTWHRGPGSKDTHRGPDEQRGERAVSEIFGCDPRGDMMGRAFQRDSETHGRSRLHVADTRAAIATGALVRRRQALSLPGIPLLEGTWGVRDPHGALSGRRPSVAVAAHGRQTLLANSNAISNPYPFSPPPPPTHRAFADRTGFSNGERFSVR